MTMQHTIEVLQNGYTEIRHLPSGLTSLWNPDGTYRHGDLRQVPRQVLEQAFPNGSNNPYNFFRQTN